MSTRRALRRWRRKLSRRGTVRRVGGVVAAVAVALAGLGVTLPATVGLARVAGAMAPPDPGSGVANDDVPTMSDPPQRIGCGPLDVRYEHAGAPVDIDADLRAVFATVAEAAGGPLTFTGRVTGVRIDVAWSSEISPAAGRTQIPLNSTIPATVLLNEKLRLPTGAVTGGWRVLGLHEAGHAMGLDHDTSSTGGVMVPAFDVTTVPQYTPAQAAAIGWAASSPSCTKPS